MGRSGFGARWPGRPNPGWHLGRSSWGSPRGRTCCLRLLFFDLNRIGFGFLLLLGTIYFLSSLPPARAGADVGVQYEVRGAMLALLTYSGAETMCPGLLVWGFGITVP